MKSIALSGKRGIGLFAKVSDEDYDYLSQWKWYLHSGGYVVRIDEHNKSILMHTVVAERAGMQTQYGYDHKERNRLDNQRESLRPASRAQNRANSAARKGTALGIKGVYQRHDTGKFTAQITVNSHRRSLGDFETAQEAHIAYLEAAKRAFGDFARSK